MLYRDTAKECNPEDTIKRIKNILSELQICTLENWVDTVHGVFIVRVSIENTRIGSNGKGSTKELALASAYGELIERLATLMPFRLTDIYPLYVNQNVLV